MSQASTRWARCFAEAVASGLSLAALPVLAQAQLPTPLGDQFQVNTCTQWPQFAYSVAVAPDGDFVVVWQSLACSTGDDDEGHSVEGQRYASDGSTQGGEFQVNTATAGDQREPSVAVAPDGDFVVVWWSYELGSYSIRGRRYASTGLELDVADFQINNQTTGEHSQPSVAVADDGDFVVTWLGTDGIQGGVQARLHNSDGSPQGSQFQVNVFTTGNGLEPSVATEADGDFVVAWENAAGLDGSGYGIRARRFTSSGSPSTSEIAVNGYTTGDQQRPSAAIQPDGNFVVVWHGPHADTDTDGSGILGRRFTSAGAPVATEFHVNTYTTNDQVTPSVTAEADGDFIVAWDSLGSAGTDQSGQSIQARRFSSDGTSLVGDFQVNTYTTSGAGLALVAAAPGGDFVVAWSSNGSPGSDNGPSSYTSVQARRYSAAAPATSFAKLFEIQGISDGIPWSWRIDMGGNTVASATSVGPVANGGGPALFVPVFIDSINSHLGSAACLAVDDSNPARFEIQCASNFQFFVNDAPGTGTACEVTGTLGGGGCAFNPTIVEVSSQVPALTPSLRLGLAAALLLLAAWGLRRRA